MKILVVAILFLGASLASAALTANAGPDQTVGLLVPVLLDGSLSNDSGGLPLTYFWNQTSGAAIAFVGFDRVRPIVIGATPAGTYVFTLTVNNGVTTATDTISVIVTNPTGLTRYVDWMLPATTTTYSIAKRDSAGTDGNGYPTFALAALAVAPGDKVLVRSGTYTDVFTTTYVNVVKLLISGTKTQPIKWQNYNNEAVVLRGSRTFSDLDLYQDASTTGPPNGRADGMSVTDAAYRETLVQLNANYNQFIGFELTNSQLVGLDNTGSYNYISEVQSHDNWYENFYMNNLTATNQTTNVYRYIEGHHSRHGSGMLQNVYSAGVARNDNVVVADSLFYLNGFQADNIKVLPTTSMTGDPAGGGNSGGCLQSKYFYDTDPLNNRGVNHYLMRNFAYHNVDDGYATSVDDLLLEDDISIGNGPTGGNGVKFYKPGRNTVSRGMVSYATLHRGWELRGVAGTTFQHFNCTSIRNWQFGVWSDTIATYDVRNVVSGFNVQSDFTTITVAGKNDWGKDGTGTVGLSGDPLLFNSNLGTPVLVPGRDALYAPGNEADNSDDYPSLFISLAWPAGSTVAAKLAFVRGSIKDALSPVAGSPLINAGQVIAGYHCPTADDSGSPPAATDPRRHWYGAAPDIGAYEFNPGVPTPTPTATPSVTPTPTPTPIPANLPMMIRIA